MGTHLCLEVIAIVGPESRESVTARSLAKTSGLFVKSYSEAGGRRLFRFAADEECSCGLVGQATLSDGPFWSLKKSFLPGLSRAVQELAVKAPPFSFIAHFQGGNRNETGATVPLVTLLGEISANRIRNRFRYEIAKPASR
jgi:hypothetical protein